MRQNMVSDAMYVINNAESIGSKACNVPYSRLIESILGIMKEQGYIGDYNVVGGVKKHIDVRLVGKINMTRAVNPRLSVARHDVEKWEKRYLPAKSFGIIIMSTSSGIMTHEKMKQLGIGGRIMAYAY